MKVKVISVFRDKFTGKYYTPGEVIEVGEEARVLDMESRRLAERIEAKNTEVKAPEEKKEVKISLFEKEFEKKALIDALKSIGAQASGNPAEKTAQRETSRRIEPLNSQALRGQCKWAAFRQAL